MKDKSLEELLEELPQTTHNCEQFGLNLCIVSTNAGRQWQCVYYSHASHKTNDAFPMCIAKSPKVAVRKMLRAMTMTDKQIKREKEKVEKKLYGHKDNSYATAEGVVS